MSKAEVKFGYIVMAGLAVLLLAMACDIQLGIWNWSLTQLCLKISSFQRVAQSLHQLLLLSTHQCNLSLHPRRLPHGTSSW